MLGPFAVLNEDFQRYLVNFHIALEAFRRDETPPDEVLDFLYENRLAGLPERAYAEEVSHSGANLERLVQLATARFREGRGETVELPTGDGTRKALSFERESKTNLLYILWRVKNWKDFWKKTMVTVGKQSEVGYYDQKGFRIIVESQEAREFRRNRRYENLSPEEKRRFEAEFPKKKVSQLTNAELERFYSIFTVGYKDLTHREQELYKTNFLEKHRKIVRHLVGEIAELEALDTIPIRPHFMKLGGLDLRVQRQVVIDHLGKEVLEFEYLLGRDSSQETDLYGKVLAASAQEEIENGYYIDYNNRLACAINFGNLVVNFRFPNDVPMFDISGLVRKIRLNYDVAQKENDFVDDLNERDSKIMESLRTKMTDIPVGFFVYSDTTTRTLSDNFRGMYVDLEHKYAFFVKDTTIHEKKERGAKKIDPEKVYEVAKVNLSLSPAHKQISGECQVRDTIMDCKAEFGGAPHDRSKEEEIGKIPEGELRFGSAFFERGEESNRALSSIYASFHAKAIQNAAKEITQIDTISRERQRFDGLAARIKTHFRKAIVRVGPEHLHMVVDAVNKTYDGYLAAKGMAVVSYLDSLSEINEMLKVASKELGVGFRYISTSAEQERIVYERHIGILYGAFERLMLSDKVEDVAAGLFVGRLITHYNEYYGKSAVSEAIQAKYRTDVIDFGRNKQWKTVKLHGRQIGIAPGRLFSKGRIYDAIQSDIEPTLRGSSVLRGDKPIDFDVNTTAKVLKVYADYTKQ